MSQTDTSVERLIDELTDRLQAGESIDLKAYADQHPDHAEQLRKLIPALEMMVHLKRSAVLCAARSAPLVRAPELELGELGDFRLLREVGRGGMGIVYQAEQISLRRRVALKVLPFAATLDARQIQRFQVEAQAAACLHHPHIVPVHGVGCERGVHYYAMQLIDGRSLAAMIAELRRLEGLDPEDGPATDLAAISTTPLADRLLFGDASEHPDGAGTGSPAVLDAPVRDAAVSPMPPTGPIWSAGSSTHSRDFVRAATRLALQAAEALDHAHARGILHRDIKPANLLLDAEGRLWVTDFGLAQIRGDDRLTLSGDVLGTLRYMSPEQALGRRVVIDGRTDIYSLGVTLYELLTLRPAFDGRDRAEVLRRIAEQEPAPPRRLNPAVPRDLETIITKAIYKDPQGRYPTADALGEDLRRFLEGRPIRARRVGVAERSWRWFRRKPALAMAGAVAATLLVAVVAISVDSARRHARAAAQLRDEQVQTKEALRKVEQLATDLALERGRSLCESGNVSQGMLWMARAYELAPRDGNDSRQEVIRTALSAWGAELSPLKAIFPSKGEVYALAVSPDGETVVTAGGDGTARLWRTADGTTLGRPMTHQAEVSAVAFSPDGKTVLTASWDHTARLWRADDGTPLGPVLRHGEAVRAAAFSPDGQTIVTGSRDCTARLWRAADGAPIGRPLSHQALVRDVAFSPDGLTVVTASHDHTARLWRAADGAPIGQPMLHRQAVGAAAFSPDGRIVATASWDHTARLWRAADGTPMGQAMSHEGRVDDVAFSPDGQTVATASWDHTARLWKAADGTPVGRPLTHQDEVYVVAFSPDGRTVVTGSRDHTARFWRTTEGAPIGTAVNHQDVVLAVAFGPDGRTAITGSKDCTSRLWHVADGTLVGQAMAHENRINAVAFSPDGQTFATASDDCTARLWRSDGTPVGRSMTHRLGVNELAFSPDGQVIATAGDDHTVRFWRAIDGAPLGKVLKHRAEVNAVAFSRDGRTIATASDDRTARLWSVPGGCCIGQPMTHAERITAVAFSPDGETVVTASRDHTARLWRAADSSPVGRPMLHVREVHAVAFSPDGRTVVTASCDHTARLWRAADGAPMGQPMSHQDLVVDVAFSPDGQTVATASWDHTARLWMASDGTPIGRPLMHPDEVRAVAFSPNGRTLATGTRGGIARLWQAPPRLDESVRRIKLWVQVVSGLELDGNEAVHVLDAESWHARRQSLQEMRGPPVLQLPRSLF
jgi:WD40 repeat protein/serine/threonine protein kinase